MKQLTFLNYLEPTFCFLLSLNILFLVLGGTLRSCCQRHNVKVMASAMARNFLGGKEYSEFAIITPSQLIQITVTSKRFVRHVTVTHPSAKSPLSHHEIIIVDIMSQTFLRSPLNPSGGLPRRSSPTTFAVRGQALAGLSVSKSEQQNTTSVQTPPFSRCHSLFLSVSSSFFSRSPSPHPGVA